MAAFAQPAYDREPTTVIHGFDFGVCEGFESARDTLALQAAQAAVVVVECYPGVSEEIFDLVHEAVRPDVTVRAEDAFYDGDELTHRMQAHLTDDRVRGVMYYGPMEDFLDPQAFADAQEHVAEACANGQRVLVYGVGATLVAPEHDLLVYCDLARWEIQLRYRAGMPNFKQHNYDEDTLRKVKRGYFVEWRIADRRKAEVFDQADWFIDSNVTGMPKLVSGEALRAGLADVAHQPFRLVPYFDPGVWGGHWMQERFGLDPNQPNFAWSFDGVPEENSLYLRFGGVRIEVPAMDLTLTHPRELLGESVYARFGAEFPIRFDFLDTMGGENLSLQVHPLTEYIRSHFGMTYTQDESYYILDAGEGAGVYLGIKDGVDPDKMMVALRDAQAGGEPFDAERYVNRFPAKKHDHFLIPAGTVHCSAANTVVLEISATPYNFTFKMWDWGRVGLDGLPRPIHLDDAERNIQWDRRTGWCREHLVDAFEDVASGEGWREEHTGLHELEFIETRRITLTTTTTHDTSKGVHMLNLVDGESCVVESPTGAWEPFVVHYAETFIVPAACGTYTLRPQNEGDQIVVMQAYVRAR